MQRSADYWNRAEQDFVILLCMRRFHDELWMQEQVARSTDVWNSLPARCTADGPVYCQREQEKRERAYDEALAAVEKEAKRAGTGFSTAA